MCIMVLAGSLGPLFPTQYNDKKLHMWLLFHLKLQIISTKIKN